MKLKKFTRTTHLKHDRTIAPTVTFTKSNGSIRLNKTLSAIMEGRPVSFHQDEENTREWFICIDEKEGFTPKTSKRQDPSLVFRCISLTNNLLESLSLDKNVSWRFLVSSEPITLDGVDYYPIITLSAKNVSN